jgi:hypothetical protein
MGSQQAIAWGFTEWASGCSNFHVERGMAPCLDKCALDTPLSETILPLIRNCFFGGAVHAVLLLQNGHGDQLTSDIASFLMEYNQDG